MESRRLQQIIKLIPDGVGVADIGTDHAQIPITLARHTNCRPIIAGEKNQGPLKIAAHWIEQAGLSDEIDLRLGSGLTILKPDEVSWAVIAGMGFKTIIEIITEAEEISRSLQGLIVQPMQGCDELRRWLNNHHFRILDEILVKEDDKLFQILVIRDGEPEQMDDIFAEIGPILYTKCDSYLEEHINNLITYHEEVKNQIPSHGERALTRIDELSQKIAELKEVLDQWQKRCSEL